MKTFQELQVFVGGDFDDFLGKIFAQFVGQWRRAPEREALIPGSRDELYCLMNMRVGIDYALLILQTRGMSLSVTNVIPVNKTEFSKDEYNEVVSIFAACAEESGFIPELTKAEVELSDVIGEALSKRLETFSHCANKSTGRSHPSDEGRWMEWVYFMVLERREIEFDHLVFFLGEQGWDDETAYQLALDYSYANRAMEYALARVRGLNR